MKKLLLSSLLSLTIAAAFSQQGYNIGLTLKPYKNEKVYLGYYYGKLKALADSVVLDGNSQGSFKGNTALPGGIYFIVSPSRQILFELLLDKEQQFSIEADTTQLPSGVVFKGSKDNALFQQYTKFANQTGSAIHKANGEIATATNKKAAEDKVKKLNEAMQHYRDSLVNRNPESLLAALLQAMKEPVVPPASKHPGGKYDSNFAYRYFKDNFWDGVEFNDDRLVRTPFFESKLDKYFDRLVSPDPDSIKPEVDYMLLYARSGKEMYKFLMVKFVQQYINPKYMGQDAVFVHLFEKFINTGEADFFSKEYKDHMTKRAYSLMANQLGLPAANMKMVDTADRPANLYDVKGEMIVLCFWDPTCSHCKEVVPKVDSIFQAKWKAQGIKVYGVMVDGGKDLWTKYIRDNNLKDWIHVYQLPAQQEAEQSAGQPSYRQLYDVFQTPMLYLLDKDKRIVAKKLDYLQLNEIINLKLKKSNTN
ncbi:redoxin domain-containing protein [Pseudoflavitalea rhizosphaerae]|uniref:redoxin domain-containing protein n=1 Tax=Pseudoflavitalea rhizosphaerae TaxID=1884793 RepID=UPI000F8CFDF9|nr:thioredoxin-like domain-containing protein [Pseudoflavitalea rhizosphaerae]